MKKKLFCISTKYAGKKITKLKPSDKRTLRESFKCSKRFYLITINYIDKFNL